MPDVRVKLVVDTSEAEAKLRELELRAQALNAPGGDTPADRVDVPGRSTTPRPGATSVVAPGKPTTTRSSVASNALVALTVGSLAGSGPATAKPTIAVEHEAAIANSATGIAIPNRAAVVPVRATPTLGSLLNRDVFVSGAAGITVPVGGGGGFGGGGRYSGGGAGGARVRAELGVRPLANIAGVSEAQWMSPPRVPMPEGYAVAGAARVRKSGWLFGVGSTMKRGLTGLRGRVLGRLSGAGLGPVTSGPAVALIAATFAVRGLANSADRLSASIRNQRDYDGSLGRVAFEETWLAGAEAIIRPAMNLDRAVITATSKAAAFAAYALGYKERAAGIMNFVDQVSGELTDRNKALMAMQDAWDRGFQEAGRAGLVVARQRSTDAAMKAIQLGLRGGTMLQLDHAIYDRISTAIRNKYQDEYLEKVQYPRMSDVQGGRD